MKPLPGSTRKCSPHRDSPRRHGNPAGLLDACGLALKKFQRLRQEYKLAYLQWSENRGLNVLSLEPLIDALEETRNNCNIASLSGGCAGLVGGLLTGAGLITIPLTAGVSAPLLIAGASLAVSGGATGLGAGLADLRLSGARSGEAQSLIDRDVRLTMQLLLLEKEYAQCLRNIETTLVALRSAHPRAYDRLSDDCDRLTRSLDAGTSAVAASRVGANALLLATVARSIFLANLGEISVATARVVTPVNPLSLLGATKLVNSVDEVVEAGGQAGVAAVRGAKAGIAAAAVLCVVGLALDITSIVYTSRQIHVHRRNRQAALTNSNTDKGTDSGSGSVRTSASTGNLNNNNRIYLKTVDKELHSDYDLCSLASNPTGAGFRPTRDPGFLDWEELLKPGGHGLWLDERSGATEDVAEGDEVSSRRSSGSWEKIEYTADMLIEVEEDSLFHNKKPSLEFNLDASSTATNDTQRLITEDTPAEEDPSFPRRLARRIKHTFTRDYISERAERLKAYSARLQREAQLMYSNPTIQDLLNECGCQHCASVGGSTRLSCCQERRLYWNSVYPAHSPGSPQQHGPARCVTQHPMFTHLYLTEASLQEELEQQKDKQLPDYRKLRLCSYRMFVRCCWGNNDVTIRIPDCVRRVVVQTFTPDVEEFWDSKDGFGLGEFWSTQDSSVTCTVM